MMSSGKRKSQYMSKDQTQDNLDRLTKRFSSDLRKQIKSFTPSGDFSTRGFFDEGVMLEHISKIANIESKPTLLTYRKQSKKTLWEKEEFCVRYVVEEGKLNVILRKMINFKRNYKRFLSGKIPVKELVQRTKIDEIRLGKKLRAFEGHLGTLICCCLTSVEAVQTLDMTLLFDYVTDTIKCALDDKFLGPNSAVDFLRVQEFVVFEYFRLVVTKLEHLVEEDLVKLILDRDLVNLSVQFSRKFHRRLGVSENYVVLASVSIVMDSELFQTYKDKFITVENKKFLVSSNEELLKPILKHGKAKQKTLRKLRDCVIMWGIHYKTNIK